MYSKRSSLGGIVALNIMVFGVVVAGLALYLIFGANAALADSLTSVNEILRNAGIRSSSYADVTDLLLVPSHLSMLLAAFAVLFLVATPLATFGAYYRNSAMMWAAVVFIFLLLLLHIAVAGVFINRMADDKTKELMLDTIKNHYIASDDNGTYSVAWNVLHQKLGCCGVVNYSDFNTALYWKRFRWEVGEVLITPFSCCRPPNTNHNCATQPPDENSFYQEGCYEKYRMLVIGHAIGTILVLGLTLIAPIMTVIKLAKKNI